jgi:DHA3 family multidrug efflux protein-like MFS transporter
MDWALWITLVMTVLATVDLLFVRIPETLSLSEVGKTPAIDIRGAVRAIQAASSLLALILFTTFNSFLSGVFMALIDPYGPTLVSVEAWGIIWGFLSFGFVVGGILVARKGLGDSPVRALFLANIAIWVISILFPIGPSIVPLIAGFAIFMVLMPVIEAAEQTVIQQVVPYETQGRVFGFAQAVESAASPITAFLIGPAAEYFVIPYMTTGAGATGIGRWFGTGPDRGMALVFIAAGLLGLAITILAMRSPEAKRLAGRHRAAASLVGRIA